MMKQQQADLGDNMDKLYGVEQSKIKKLLTKKTKAVIPVHLNGRSADMEAILEVAQENNISVVEDAAQAMYSRNQNGYLGTQSDIGCLKT